MSTKKPAGPKTDARTNRTRHALALAMFELGAKEGVDAVTPGRLARKSGVSRSTFYANFASKDDYLDRAFAAMFQRCDEAQKRDRPGDTGVLPSWHLFHHIHSPKDFAAAIAKSKTFAQYLSSREALFRDRAMQNLKLALPNATKGEVDGLASMLAGAFAGLMRHWMETGLSTPPDSLHEKFEQFARRALR